MTEILTWNEFDNWIEGDRISIEFFAVIHVLNSFDSFSNLEHLDNLLIVLTMLAF